jgi:hypothetical protein
MKTYSVWSEGFAATGESGTAVCHGTVAADNFKEACKKIFKKDPYFNENSLSYWGCGLFDNEANARKTFG